MYVVVNTAYIATSLDWLERLLGRRLGDTGIEDIPRRPQE